jgi:N-acyl amino acid synthase of PEP-CTERM/exosortase system
MSVDICDHFFQYFSLSIADTPELLAEVYQIRYQVYCEELNYEPKDNFPDGMETDIYDRRSLHCLLKHNPSGLYAGCVRIVLADNNLEALFPFERVCSHNLNSKQTWRSKFGEISRLAVTADFRKRKGEQNTSTGIVLSEEQANQPSHEKRQFSLIALSLYLVCTSIAVELEIDALTMMEAKLARHLRRYGLVSHLIGDFVDYHGRRAPFILHRQEVTATMNPEIQSLFEAIYLQLQSAISKRTLDIQDKSKLLLSMS